MKLDSSEEIANRYKQDTKRKKVNEDSIGDVQAKPRRRQIALQIGRRARVRQRVGKQRVTEGFSQALANGFRGP